MIEPWQIALLFPLAAIGGVIGALLAFGLKMLIVWVVAQLRGEYWLDSELAWWLLLPASYKDG